MYSYGAPPRAPPVSVPISPDQLQAATNDSAIPILTSNDLQFSRGDYYNPQPQAPEGSWNTNLSPNIGGIWESDEQAINYSLMMGNMDNAGWWTGPPSDLLQQNFSQFNSSGLGLPITVDLSSLFGGE
ncbi:hypothetical protein H0H81_006655, partial [Sphagnurus paluster]